MHFHKGTRKSKDQGPAWNCRCRRTQFTQTQWNAESESFRVRDWGSAGWVITIKQRVVQGSGTPASTKSALKEEQEPGRGQAKENNDMREVRTKSKDHINDQNGRTLKYSSYEKTMIMTLTVGWLWSQCLAGEIFSSDPSGSTESPWLLLIHPMPLA